MNANHATQTLLGVVASFAVLAATLTSGADEQTDAAPFRIVSADWVAEHAADPAVRILDVRTSVADYQTGHIPGAVFLANDALRAPLGGVPVQYLDPEEMASLFARAGVNAGDQVVVYADGADVLGATMAAYGLHRVGHRNVAILDGGIEAYRRANPLTQEYPGAPMGTISPSFDKAVFVTLGELTGLMKSGGVKILDTRPAGDYFGNTSRWMRNGHIPGAINLDWHALMNPGNLHAFRPVDEMRRIVESTGVVPSDDVIVYCGTSREATLVYLVMRHLLGYPSVRLYEGSWTEYCSKMELPVERSPVGSPAGAGAQHLPTTDRLEPFECGAVERLHTWNDIFLASQPGIEDFKQAKMGGVRTVINQRHAAENTEFDEREAVTALGMNYFNPAWNKPEELTDQVIDQTLELLRTAERPILMHCSSANRTGAVWLAYSVLDRGLSWDAALAEARTVGLRSPELERIVQLYVARKQLPGRLPSLKLPAR